MRHECPRPAVHGPGQAFVDGAEALIGLTLAHPGSGYSVPVICGSDIIWLGESPGTEPGR
jgi:hypothetical protein